MRGPRRLSPFPRPHGGRPETGRVRRQDDEAAAADGAAPVAREPAAAELQQQEPRQLQDDRLHVEVHRSLQLGLPHDFRERPRDDRRLGWAPPGPRRMSFRYSGRCVDRS